MEPIRPSDSYKLLVLLAEIGGIDTIVTTNFDMMLERAQYELGRDVFQVFSPGLARPHNNPYGRFEPLKKPYLKLHGDIGARYITLLTTDELKNGEYDASILELLNSTLKTHDIVFVGYSGYDPALAKIISVALSETDKRIYWCGPSQPASDTSLYNGIKPQFVRINFDELMSVVAKPVLERPSLAATEPTYVSCLFDWRVDYCNKEYKNHYGSRSGKPIEDTFARRKKVEDSVALFLKASQPLAIITGPSGFGKTTIGVRLLKTYQKDPSNRVMLIRSRSLVNNGDIEQHIGEQLGGLGSREPFSLFRLERWLRERGVRLILYIDGVNEFSPELNRCVQYFRNILRFCYFLPETYSAIRVIATIRQETWNVMLRHLDAVQLSKTVWSNDGASQSFNTISCAAFSDEELDDALSRVNKASSVPIDIGRFSPSFINQIRDPYLFRMLADAAQQGLPPIPSAQVYQRAFENKLKKLGESVHIPTLKDILASVALLCLKLQQDRFRETDIDQPELRGDVIRMMKDINVFVDAGDGFLQFDHDRTFEYFLALGFASNSPPHLETIGELTKFLQEFNTQSKPIAAARLYFQLEPQDRFHIIADSLQLLDSEKDRLPLSDKSVSLIFRRSSH